MAEPSIQTPSSNWNIPPPGERGDVSPLTALVAKKRSLKATAIWVARPNNPNDRRALDILSETCREMGIADVPKLSIYDSYSPNAACISGNGEVIISTNLLDIMSGEQVKAVLGHELTHRNDRNIMYASIFFCSILASVITAFSYNAIKKTFPRMNWDAERKPRWIEKWIINPVSAVLGSILYLRPFTFGRTRSEALSAGLVWGLDLPLFASFAAWVSRKFELHADLGGMRVAGADASIAAFKTLEGRSQEIDREERKENKRDISQFIPKPIRRILASHPSLNYRIDYIKAHAPKGYTTKHLEEVSSRSNPVMHHEI